jgi:hypothetical protein
MHMYFLMKRVDNAGDVGSGESDDGQEGHVQSAEVQVVVVRGYRELKSGYVVREGRVAWRPRMFR